MELRQSLLNQREWDMVLRSVRGKRRRSDAYPRPPRRGVTVHGWWRSGNGVNGVYGTEFHRSGPMLIADWWIPYQPPRTRQLPVVALSGCSSVTCMTEFGTMVTNEWPRISSIPPTKDHQQDKSVSILRFQG